MRWCQEELEAQLGSASNNPLLRLGLTELLQAAQGEPNAHPDMSGGM